MRTVRYTYDDYAYWYSIRTRTIPLSQDRALVITSKFSSKLERVQFSPSLVTYGPAYAAFLGVIDW